MRISQKSNLHYYQYLSSLLLRQLESETTAGRPNVIHLRKKVCIYVLDICLKGSTESSVSTVWSWNVLTTKSSMAGSRRTLTTKEYWLLTYIYVQRNLFQLLEKFSIIKFIWDITTSACHYFANLAIFKWQHSKLYSCKHFSTRSTCRYKRIWLKNSYMVHHPW